jgi:uncharacterized phage protein gp47/JayE
MADFPTFQELFRIERDEMLSRNGELTREIIEREGSDANLIVAGGAAAADECIGQLAQVEAAVFLDSAKGRKLDRLVFDRYGMLRKPASPAVGTVQFFTTAPAPAPFSIPLNTKVATADGRQFVTTAAANYAGGSLGPVSVQVQSVLAGASQQAKSNTITSIVGQIAGAPADLKVNNPLATAGADDEESDDDLRDRARRFWTTARRGTLAAIQTKALEVPGVRKATAFEALDVYGRPAKVVQLVIADAFTEQLVGVNPTPLSYETQSQVLADNVFAALSDTRAAGIFVQVQLGQVILQGVQLGLSFQAGVSVDKVALQARAIVVATINSLSPGETLTRTRLINALRLITGLVVTGNEILSPAGDVVVQPLQVLRSTLSLVLAVSIQPERAIQSTTNPDVV